MNEPDGPRIGWMLRFKVDHTDGPSSTVRSKSLAGASLSHVKINGRMMTACFVSARLFAGGQNHRH